MESCRGLVFWDGGFFQNVNWHSKPQSRVEVHIRWLGDLWTFGLPIGPLATNVTSCPLHSCSLNPTLAPPKQKPAMVSTLGTWTERETFKLWEVSSRSDLYMEFRDSIWLNFMNSRSFVETNLNELVFWHAVCCRHWGCEHRLLGHRTPFHRAVYEVLVLTLAISLETHRFSKGVHDSCGSKSRWFFLRVCTRKKTGPGCDFATIKISTLQCAEMKHICHISLHQLQ